jgi:hypothetical protein
MQTTLSFQKSQKRQHAIEKEHSCPKGACFNKHVFARKRTCSSPCLSMRLGRPCISWCISENCQEPNNNMKSDINKCTKSSVTMSPQDAANTKNKAKHIYSEWCDQQVPLPSSLTKTSGTYKLETRLQKIFKCASHFKRMMFKFDRIWCY